MAELSTLGDVIKTAYEAETNTNAFTDTEQTKLAGIETAATADQSAAEILTALLTVDGAASLLDADLLDGSEASAFATAAQGALADSALQAADIGVSVQAWDAQLDTWAGIAPSAFGQSLVVAADGAAVQDLLDLEPDIDVYSVATADATFLTPADIASGTITPRADDIDLSGGSTGDVLRVQSDGSLAVEALPAAGAFALDDATDVALDTPIDNDLLVFVTDHWENQTLAEAGVTANAATSLAGNGYFLDEDDMTSNDATKVASQQSIKAYVDAQVAAGVADGDKGDITVSGTGATWTIDADVIDGTNIVDDAINSEHIADGAIDLAHMSVNSIDSDQYVDGSIDAAHLAADIIDGTKLADDAVNSEHLADGSIDTVHLSAEAVSLTDVEETASFIFAFGDERLKMIRANHAATPITATVPLNSTAAFAIGSLINIVQWGDAAVTIAATGGVTINKPASKTLVIAEKYGVASLWKQGTDTWLLFGHLTDA